MNQTELNEIATHFIRTQSSEVASKISDLLHEDSQERADQIAGLPLHYIHNMALFDCLAYLNSFFAMENNSKEAVREYSKYAETLRPKFLDIMESLKDFQPTAENSNDDVSSE